MKLTHRDTGDTIEVPDNAVLDVYRKSGWAPEGDTVPGDRGEVDGTLHADEEVLKFEDEPPADEDPSPGTKRKPRT